MKQFKYLAIIFIITLGLSPVTAFSAGDADQLV